MPLTIKDALRLATKDQTFANELVTNPEAMKAHFNLSDAQINQLKNLGSAAAKAKVTLGGGIGVHGPAMDYD
jgi:hypothetical protein